MFFLYFLGCTKTKKNVFKEYALTSACAQSVKAGWLSNDAGLFLASAGLYSYYCPGISVLVSLQPSITIVVATLVDSEAEQL